MDKYIYNKNTLPEIFLTNHAELVSLYDYAFKTAFKNIDYIDKPILIAMMFLLEGFYTNSPGACIFWVFGGYLIHGIYQDQEQTVK